MLELNTGDSQENQFLWQLQSDTVCLLVTMQHFYHSRTVSHYLKETALTSHPTCTLHFLWLSWKTCVGIFISEGEFCRQEGASARFRIGLGRPEERPARWLAYHGRRGGAIRDVIWCGRSRIREKTAFYMDLHNNWLNSILWLHYCYFIANLISYLYIQFFMYLTFA